ncbi:pentapeptide repeat-containing protein [Octadecabacter sp. G9-8]|uniref:Pentapeptide repeat-containing protein n=1 Tax=Octadecabacter dasysiphoniae TaxID=2909341 RepID=A0ABS9CZ70_9RHOB|nr:pentapeptide repeat-containing protein [Octadecabacter dasysiphoniae]MCF2872458.1 pentapeptide repeat-containing protein [Octadecabacter dasysiphoniae]
MDEVVRTPANENPWYVLMTLHGEQEIGALNSERHRDNREAWNTILQRGSGPMSDKARESGITLPPSGDWHKEHRSIEALWLAEYQSRNAGVEWPTEFSYETWPCDLSRLHFVRPVHLHGFFLPKGAIFDGSNFSEGLMANTAFFGGRLSLIDATLKDDLKCEVAHFEDGVNLTKAVLSKDASFSEATVIGDFITDQLEVAGGLKCKMMTIDGTINAVEMTVERDTSFEDASCSGAASFRDSTFKRKAGFEKAKFGGDLDFDGTIVDGRLSFHEATIDGRASFKGRSGFQKERETAHFGTKALFSAAHFKGRVDFYLRRFGPPEANAPRATVLTFANAMFEQPVSFEAAIFPDLMPVLSNTTLPASTRVTARDTHWPLIHIGWRQGRIAHEQNAEIAKESAAALRHAMNRQSLPEEEHFFFAREMHHAARIGGQLQRLPYRLFGWISGYGGSIERPAFGLLWLFIAPLGVYFASLGPAGGAAFGKAAGLSFASIFKFLGFQRTYFGAVGIQEMHWIVQLLTATQTVLAFILLFFLGLGLRTRFRLR